MAVFDSSALFTTPHLSDRDQTVLTELETMRADLQHALREPRRWTGQLRRTLLAKAVQGSNSIEGYVVDTQDAVAAIDDEQPLTADEQTWLEITGYRRALSYVLQLRGDPDFRFDSTLLKSLHFMLLSHDLSKWPGRYRQGPVYVRDDNRDAVVYEGVAWEHTTALVDELLAELGEDDSPAYVRAAMAHLNLVMIHPFKDGNGRMARVLQTLIVAQDRIVSPECSSVEEYLGRNTNEYYSVLAEVGGGSWNPDRDALPWVRFSLRAHHIQAQTVAARLDETGRVYEALESLARRHSLPSRAVDGALFDASLGLLVRRSAYVARTDVEDRTATRDLQAMVDVGLLIARGERRGRTYGPGPEIAEVRRAARATRRPVHDPYAATSATNLPF